MAYSEIPVLKVAAKLAILTAIVLVVCVPASTPSKSIVFIAVDVLEFTLILVVTESLSLPA
ncbi:hypothetical protein BHECKSOX2_1435 [Bathymodiolus heckerae thiotrophic gill symbiont]|nr:hypothetical protein BHECKSOX2_1435 [Bathymodiolus heckerae thiotrophic gill symbiont]